MAPLFLTVFSAIVCRTVEALALSSARNLVVDPTFTTVDDRDDADMGFDLDRSVTPAEVAGLPTRNYKHLQPLLRKLEAGGNVTVLVIGGSMTWGALCTHELPSGRKIMNQNCAWPARFQRQLQARYPQSEVVLHNEALCGEQNDAHLGRIGITLNALDYNVDLVMLDLTINGGTDLGTEKLIRAFRTLVPSAAMFGLLTNYKNAPWYDDVFNYYGVPTLDFSSLVKGKPSRWQPHYAKGDTPKGWKGYQIKTTMFASHPDWQTHEAIADVIAGMFARVSDMSLSAGLQNDWQSKALPHLIYYGADVVDYCLKPLSHFSARQPSNFTDSKAPQGTWSLYEDRPGKPGWITESIGSKMRFVVGLGSQRKIGIIFLKSYKGVGNAFVSIEGSSWPGQVLTGHWGLDSAQTSLAVLDIADYVQGDEAYVDIEFLGSQGKFKVTDVISC